MNITYEQYLISDDKSLLDIGAICGLLARTYWANKRSIEKIEESIQNSLCYGVYHNQKQIGFARVVTDRATIYYLCDVCIAEEYRGRGIGKRLIEAIVNSEELKGITGLLGTADAHELYAKYGFVRDTVKFMIKRPNTIS
jgi:GNAT superfamily N-acetyltransferase